MKYINALFFLLLVTVAACEDSAVVTLPVIEDQHISFTIDGQQQSLRGVDEATLYINALTINTATEENYLYLRRMSSDNEVVLSITAENIPVRKLEKGMAYVGETYSPATIEVRTSEISGGIYCPHEENATFMTYEALLSFDSFDENGRMIGSFRTKEGADNPVELLNGTFDLHVNLRE